MKPEQACRRALRDMSESRVIRKLRREGDTVFFQMTHETITESAATYSREAEVALDCTTGKVSCDDPTIGMEAQRLLDDHTGKRLCTDLTKLLQKYFETRAADLIPIREQGGAYFVPEMHAALVESARVLLNSIGGKLRTFAVRLGSNDTAESVADSFAGYMQDLIREFRTSCAGLSEESRSDAKANRMATIASLKQKLELYSGLLAGFADTISQEVSAAEVELLRALASPAQVKAEAGVAHA
jgi:hypothetical protein